MADEQRVALEKIIRPIVEGQIRGFIKEHPSILKGVDWYKPRTDKEKTLINSMAKRIVRDLVCGMTSARLEAVFVAPPTATQPISAVECIAAPKRPTLALVLEWATKLFTVKQ